MSDSSPSRGVDRGVGAPAPETSPGGGAAPDDPGVPREHHLTVARAARFHMLGQPSPRVRECWFVLHGYGQLAGRFVRHFAGLANPSRLVVAPEALSRFYLGDDVTRHAQSRVGASWMTREDRLAEIGDHVAYLDALWARLSEGLDPGSVALGVLGFSQGAAMACRWAALGAAPARRLVLWGGSVPDDLPMDVLRERLQGTPLALVVGDQDQFRSPEAVAAQMERLRVHEVPGVLRTFSGGHHMDAATLADVIEGYSNGS